MVTSPSSENLILMIFIDNSIFLGQKTSFGGADGGPGLGRSPALAGVWPALAGLWPALAGLLVSFS